MCSSDLSFPLTSLMHESLMKPSNKRKRESKMARDCSPREQVQKRYSLELKLFPFMFRVTQSMSNRNASYLMRILLAEIWPNEACGIFERTCRLIVITGSGTTIIPQYHHPLQLAATTPITPTGEANCSTICIII